MRTHDNAVLEQFDPKAETYLASAVHSAGPDLERALELVRSAAPRSMLDVGCGAGHLSFALAPALERVVASDPAPAMLATVERAARERGLGRIETRRAAADALPFYQAAFCLVSTRYSAHHWRDLPAALREMRRTLKPNGYLLAIDVLGDDAPLVDTHLQALELLRDPSHVRNRSAAEWRALLERSGFAVADEAHWPLRLEFRSWVERMRVPAETVAAIRRLQAAAPQEVHDGLAIERDGSFTVRTGLFWARAA
jgi:ubiquinone/menaquinone biosynthesis C-methylase UbiE